MLYDWLRHIEFAYPKLLSLFIILPVLIWWYVKKYNRSQGALEDVDCPFFYSFIIQKYFEAFAIYFAAPCIDLYYPGFSETQNMLTNN